MEKTKIDQLEKKIGPFKEDLEERLPPSGNVTHTNKEKGNALLICDQNQCLSNGFKGHLATENMHVQVLGSSKAAYEVYDSGIPATSNPLCKLMRYPTR